MLWSVTERLRPDSLKKPIDDPIYEHVKEPIICPSDSVSRLPAETAVR
jgi:hypothetical protein